MRFPLLALLALLAPLPALAQVTPTPRLPPANPLPYEDPDAAAVMAPVNAIFAALAAHDGQAVLAHVRPEGKVTVASERPDGTRAIRDLDWAGFAANLKPGPEKLEERMPNPAIEVDGDIAMVWGAFTFLIDGKVHHCGVNHFDLIRENGQWKVLNITWSSRTTGCQ